MEPMMSMTILTISLLCSLALNGLILWLSHLERQKWMRMFSHQQGIPLNIMDPEPARPETPVREKPKRKLTIPIPGADWMRREK
jgi:hypothetical protein